MQASASAYPIMQADASNMQESVQAEQALEAEEVVGAEAPKSGKVPR